jgi:hypothetical protein
MSKEAVQSIIGRAVVDVEFRESLFTDPEQVLAEYELTGEEVAALKAIDSEAMEAFVGALDERISKAMAPYEAMGQGGSGPIRMLDPKSLREMHPLWWIRRV